MSSQFLLFLTVFLLLTLHTHAVPNPPMPYALRKELFSKCRRPARPGVPPSDKFCARPPTPFVSLPAYAGTWYNIFNSGIANLFVGGGRCTTANYTLTSPTTIDVLNCDISIGKGDSKPQCVRAEASRRPGTKSPSKLQVFFPAAPLGIGNPGPYNIAALIGDGKLGYIAAGVFFCAKAPDGSNRTGIFVISRFNTYNQLILSLVKRELRCRGYDISEKFVEVDHNKCNYFFDEGGFDIRRSGNSPSQIPDIPPF